MHNEELIRRSAELKARMLAQRNADAREQSSSTTRKRKSVKREPHSDDSVVDDVNALKKHIAQLDAENEAASSVNSDEHENDRIFPIIRRFYS
jgi:hypothetical protein